MQAVIDKEKAGGGYNHAFQHDAGSSGADADAVEQEGGKAGKRNSQHPIEIGSRRIDDFLFVGEQAEETFASDAI